MENSDTWKVLAWNTIFSSNERLKDNSWKINRGRSVCLFGLITGLKIGWIKLNFNNNSQVIVTTVSYKWKISWRAVRTQLWKTAWTLTTSCVFDTRVFETILGGGTLQTPTDNKTVQRFDQRYKLSWKFPQLTGTPDRVSCKAISGCRQSTSLALHLFTNNY